MILVVGGPSDVLANQVVRHLQEASASVCFLSEDALYEVPFSWERHGRSVHGVLHTEAGAIELADLSAVLLRPPRTWSPSLDLTVQDYTFVYHETIAAWLCILSSVVCPVVNRFELGWWLGDVAYPVMLRKDLARRLQIALAPQAIVPSLCAGENVSPPSPPMECTSVYVLDGRVIASATADAAVRRLLAARRQAVRCWQQDHGVALCRLDFARAALLQLVDVDICPWLDDEYADVVEQLCAATVEVLT